MSITRVTHDTEINRREMTQSDRCDRCGAQAFGLAVVKAVVLLFCGHHYGMHRLALYKVATRMRDERPFINAEPSPSASEIK